MTHPRAARSQRTYCPQLGQRVARGAPRALAVALLGIVAGPSSVAAEPCRTRTELVGDGEAVEAVAQELGRLGVQVDAIRQPPALGAATPSCRTVRADVELDREGGIAVAIMDGPQRSEGRVVSDAAVAAAWIESFVRDDVDGFSHTTPPPATTATATTTATAALATGGDRRSVFERFGASVAFEQAWPEGEGVRASGVGVAMCARAGAFCVGVRARYAGEADRAVNLTAMGRSDVSLLATASTAFTLGHLTIVPELGLGAGRMSTRRLECEPTAPPPNCDPTTDPSCVPDGSKPPDQPGSANVCDGTVNAAGELSKVYVGDELHAVTYTPRAAAALHITVPLFDRVWLEGTASVEAAPFGHTGDFTTLGADGALFKDATLPGEPVDTIQLGVGLRVGTP